MTDPAGAGDVTVECAVRTTAVQREVWLAHHLSEEAALGYCMVLKLTVRGVLQAETAADAVQALHTRHQSLRATFSPDGAEMFIHRPHAVVIERFDYSSLAAVERASAARSRLRNAVRQAYDLARGPLFSAELITLASGEHLVLLKSHHIVCDGWSLGVLMDDFGELYAQLRDGRAPALPAPAFSDYAGRASSAEGEGAMDAAYWKEIFKDPPESLELPLDRARSARRSLASGRVDRPLAAALLLRLEEQARSRDCSLYTALLAAFAVVLSRLARTRDLVIGVPVSGQLRNGMTGLVGHCVHLLPLRFTIDPAQPFGELVRATQDGLRAAACHGQLSYTRLIEELGLRRSPDRPPLASVVLTTLRLPDRAVPGTPQLVMSGEHVAREFENFELLANVFLAGSRSRIECQYSSALYDCEAVQGWFALFEAVIDAAGEDFSRAVSLLPSLTPEEASTLGRWNETTAPYDRSARVHSLVESAARSTPGNVAVTGLGLELSYQELEAQANRLARALRSQGARRGARVGLLLERGPRVVIALLAVLKSGAAYVPLDPDYPRERLAHMANDSGIALLIADAGSANALEWPRECTLLLDAQEPAIAMQSSAPLAADEDSARPEDPAYVIYTSGSSGVPKGVVVPHRAVVNFLASMRGEPGITPEDRFLAVTTLSFDIAVLELLLPLTAGARTVVAPAAVTRDGYALSEWIESHGATAMQATPATWRMLIESGWRDSPRLKALVGGESLPPDLARALQGRTRELWNLYGPTETTVWSTCWKVERPESGIAIGRPIANTRVFVLDENRTLCPIGVPGEIWIGGDGVSLGYWKQPDLTAERFMAVPGLGAEVLYRTGDRGRWRRDGLLEHQGRLDAQVKIRGFRIEPAEIERRLTSHPAVAAAVVAAREVGAGDVALVAYVVCEGGVPPSAALRDHLREHLPHFMIPQQFVGIVAVPRLPNGKVDLGRLPVPRAELPRTSASDAPRTDAERAIANVWGALLETSEIGVNDNFFDLGGHSLLAMTAVVRIEKETGVRLHPQQMIFESLGQLASTLERAGMESRGARVGWLRRTLAWIRG